MADYIIPTRQDSEDYEVEVELSGVFFFLRFTWNYRSEYWYLTISDADRVVVAGNLKITVGTALLRTVPGTSKPAGELIAIDTTNAGLEAGLEDLGDRVLLFYDGT